MPPRAALRSLVLCVLCSFGAAPLRAQASSLPDSTARAIDRVFNAWSNNDGPGCAVGVSRDGSPIVERGYGMANLETNTPITPASIFHVASVSKQFTAMAIMLLVHDGKLSVDDNIRKYIPEIPDYGTPITIRHLLTHTSGLRDQWSLISLERGRFDEDRITEADVMDVVTRQKALNFTPGAEYLYSNTGFTLLGVIVKRVSGQSLREFADTRIFKPLGMAHSHFHDDYTMLVPGRTSAYVRRGGAWHVSIPNYDTYGATNLFTTVGDLLKWEANLDEPRVGDPSIIAQMQRPTPLTTGDTSYYGFGLTLATYRGLDVVEHNGADAGYRTYTGRFPGHGVAITVLCNAGSANTTMLARGVADAVLAGSFPKQVAEAIPQGVALSRDQLERRAGVYVQPTTLEVVELGVHDGKLAVKQGQNYGPTFVPLDDRRFRTEGQPFEITFADGEHAGFTRRPVAGRPTVRFERREATALSPKALAAFAGSYASEELGGTIYRVTATDSTLAFRTGTSDPVVTRPVFADTFVGQGYTIQFVRSHGAVTGFEVTNGRMRRVGFQRTR
jgi:CubicO group peptidase (beta-lactamase class C family)